MSYFLPRSTAWLAGVGAIATGLAMMFMPDSFALSEIGRLIVMFAGGDDASPAGLVFIGLGLIGLRAKLERAYAGRPD